MNICFDNDRRLRRKSYLFEYKGHQFKLVQSNPRKWADTLLTILPADDDTLREKAFSVASEFLSALCWQNNARTAIAGGGGRGWDRDWKLSNANPTIYEFPTIPFGGNVIGYDISVLPLVETDPQKVALTLYREAGASNNNYLSFLFYWQILETGGTNAEGFVNKTFRKKPRELRLGRENIDSRLNLNGKSLGEYLRDECRDAIAHIRRKPGKKRIDLDKAEDRLRVIISTNIVQVFAKYYIEHVLKLQKKLYLVRSGRGKFPFYADEKYTLENRCEIAYR